VTAVNKRAASSRGKIEVMTATEIEAALAALRETLNLIDTGTIDATDVERAHIAGSIAALRTIAASSDGSVSPESSRPRR
jgi:hypothetical protein